MGNPAHTATQGVNLRIQGPKHPPIGPNTPPIRRALPPSTHAREDEANAGNERPPRTSRGHTHTKDPGLVTCVRTRPGLSRVNDPDYSRKFIPKSMAPSASRKSSDTEPSLKSASE